MGELILTDLATGLLSKLISLAAEQAILAMNLKDDLDNLNGRLKLVRAFLSDAESRPVTLTVVQEWLNKLNAVAFDADLVLDELHYKVLRQKVERERKRDVFKRINFRSKMANKIKDIGLALDAIYKTANEIGLKPVEHIRSSNVDQQVLQTPPYTDESLVLGRDKDVSNVLEWLLHSNHEEEDLLPVLAIAGMPGQGKTTLAQLIFNSNEVKGKFGDRRIWITVSLNFEVTRLLKEMVESLTQTNPQLTNIGAIIKQLQDSLQGKEYLLVLDDVWNQDSKLWETLKNSLLGIGSRGSKIIITTRSYQVALAMEASLTYPLEELSQGDSWALFEQRAFAKSGAIRNEKLKAICERMVKRCGGLPLAIKMLGGLLSSIKSEDEWLKIEKSPIWEQTDVLPSLRLSYDHLPSSSLKKCFSFCSMFPQDSKFVKDELILRWMALGLLYPPEGSILSMEEVGVKYYDTLLRNSFLQNAEKDEYGNITSCMMHDLVHALAVSLSKNYCKTLPDDEVITDRRQVLHLVYEGKVYKVPETLSSNFDRLQTLVINVGLPNNILRNLKCLRVLVFESWDTEELPSSIGKLKHLRLLDISQTRIRTLPDSITKLYNLQTLQVYFLDELPKNFGNMISLRHFCIDYISECRAWRFSRIGQLTSLRTLPLFIVNRDEVSHIEDLGGLSNLRGDLNIHRLEHLSSTMESEKAKLCRKTNINTLVLSWSYRDLKEEEGCKDEEVLNGLQPNLNLRNLEIKGFQGKNFASWMMPTQLHNLVKISLIYCKRCKQIPTLGHLAHLRDLKISGLKNVTRIGPEFYSHGSGSTSSGGNTMSEVIFFPALRMFSVEDMEKLQEWLEPECSLNKVFPCLEELRIEYCKNLTMVPTHFPSLERLTIRRVGGADLVLLLLKNITGLQKLEALERLNLRDCLNLVSLPDELYSLTSLKEMDISLCPELINIPAVTSLRSLSISDCSSLSALPSGMELCTSLETLQIYECHRLKNIPAITSLRSLSIYKCPSLSALPSGMELCTSLKEMDISMCPELKNIPAVTSLRSLRIEECSSLTALPSGLELCTSLETLQIRECNRSLELLPRLLPKLTHLELSPFDRDYFPWLLPDVAKNTFVATVQHLGLWMGFGDKNIPDKFQYFSAVKDLKIYNGYLETLPEWLGDLSSLQSLRLVWCEKLKYFPSVEAMSRLKKLTNVDILDCPLLKKRLTEGKRPEWCKIANISEIEIDCRTIKGA